MAWHAAACAMYVVLTIALTWPLAGHLGELLPHDLGDTLLSTTLLWWNAHVMPFTERWWDGNFFHPARNSLTLSDHRVGLGLIATPAIWAGASPIAAHNLVFLATYALSATAAYALCFSLTRSRAAAFLGGLVFGFNPFRAGHLPHLELLASYWLPLVFVSLHQWRATRRPAWLVALAGSLALQAITCGYYFFFAAVLVGLWLLWFLRRGVSWREYAGLGAALAAPLATIAPVLLVYRRAHDEMSLMRHIDEIEQLSADLLGLITPPDPLFLWNTPQSWLRMEGEILIGVTAAALVVCAAVLRRPATRDDARPGLRRARVMMLIASVGAALVATLPALYGPVEFSVGPIRVSTSSVHKPLSVAAACLTVWALTSARVRDAFRRQSVPTFYALATIAMLVLALGPTPRLLGERVLYKAPYAWLMLLPGFHDEFRAPARFAMLAALTLSVAAALAFQRLLANRPVRMRLAATLATAGAILLESWIVPFPLVAAPRPMEIPPGVPTDAVVLELPMGTFEDARAMYRATFHRRPVVNGMSGYSPPHFTVLHAAMTDRKVEALLPLAADRDIAVFVLRNADAEGWRSLVETRTPAERIGTTRTHDVLLLRRPSAAGGVLAPRLSGSLMIRDLQSNLDPEHLHRMRDGDVMTAWVSGPRQVGGEELTVDLGDIAEVHAITLGLGPRLSEFPRLLVIAASSDGVQWVEAWRGGTAVQAVAAALQAPRDVPLWIDLDRPRARYLRLKQLEQSESGWAIAELSVWGGGAGR